MNNGRLFYDSEHDAFATAVANSGRELKEIGCHLWQGMKPDSAYAKLKACLNPQGDQQFKFHEIVALMHFCKCYDPLMYACDETLHARPARIAPEDEQHKLVEEIGRATEQLNRALTALDKLRDRKPLARAA